MVTDDPMELRNTLSTVLRSLQDYEPAGLRRQIIDG
jgi:hypothetical protein